MQIDGYAAIAGGLWRTQAHQTGTLHAVSARQGRRVGIGPVTIDIPQLDRCKVQVTEITAQAAKANLLKGLHLVKGPVG